MDGKVKGPFWPQPAIRPDNTTTPRVNLTTGRALRRGIATLDCVFMQEILATMSIAPEVTALSDAEYQRRTDRILAAIEASVDRWLQDDVIDIDPMRTGGMLELDFPDRSRIVVNTQPPLQELWLAARAGGFHYRFRNGQWVDTKDGSEFFAVLSREASAQAGQVLEVLAPE